MKIKERGGSNKGGSIDGFPRKVWKILVEPQDFFSSLQEDSLVPSISWIVGGSAVMVFVGGLLSVLLSVSVGIPLAKVLEFLNQSDARWLGYLLFLAIWFLEIVGLSIVELLVYHLGAKILHSSGGLIKTAQVVAYGTTPMFIAFALPQLLAKELSMLSPLVRIVATSYNYSIDFVQLASMVWALWLWYTASRAVHGFSRTRAWVFVLVPGLVMAGVVAGFQIIMAIVVPAGIPAP